MSIVLNSWFVSARPQCHSASVVVKEQLACNKSLLFTTKCAIWVSNSGPGAFVATTFIHHF